MAAREDVPPLRSGSFVQGVDFPEFPWEGGGWGQEVATSYFFSTWE